MYLLQNSVTERFGNPFWESETACRHETDSWSWHNKATGNLFSKHVAADEITAPSGLVAVTLMFMPIQTLLTFGCCVLECVHLQNEHWVHTMQQTIDAPVTQAANS